MKTKTHSLALAGIATLACACVCVCAPAASAASGAGANDDNMPNTRIAPNSPSAPDSVAALRARFFSGPALRHAALDKLDPADLPDDSRIGVVAHLSFYEPGKKNREQYKFENMLPFLRAAGVKWVRDDARVQIAPDGSQTLPAGHQHWLDGLEQAGIRHLLVTTRSTPKTRELPARDFPDQKYLDYVAFVLKNAARAGGAVQTWNEPNNWGFQPTYGGRWNGGPWLEKFAGFEAWITDFMHTTSPGCFVVAGNQNPLLTLEQYKIKPARVDAVDMHHYSRRFPPEYAPRAGEPLHEHARKYLDEARKLTGNPKLQLWITETGYSTFKGRAAPGAESQPAVTEDMQARLVGRSLLDMLLAPVDRVFWYSMMDAGRNATATDQNFGLVTADGRPKPAYFVFARVIALTRGSARPAPEIKPDVAPEKTCKPRARAVGQASVESRVMTGALRRDDGVLLVPVWATDILPEDPDAEKISFQANVFLPAAIAPEGIVVADLRTGASEAANVSVSAKDGRRVVRLTVEDCPKVIVIPAQPQK